MPPNPGMTSETDSRFQIQTDESGDSGLQFEGRAVTDVDALPNGQVAVTTDNPDAIQDEIIRSALEAQNRQAQQTEDARRQATENSNRNTAIRTPVIAAHHHTAELRNITDRNKLFTDIRDRLGYNEPAPTPEELAAGKTQKTAADLDRKRRVDRDYGTGVIGRINAALSNADLKQGPTVWQDLAARAVKVAGKTAISGAIGYATLAVLTATASAPIMLTAVGVGGAARGVYELGRFLKKDERKARVKIEAGNAAFMDYIKEYYEESELLKMQIITENPRGYDAESDPRYVGRMVKVFEMLADEGKRRVIDVTPLGEKVKKYKAVDIDTADADGMINLGEQSKALRKKEKGRETVADIVAAVTSIGYGIASKIMAGKKIAEAGAAKAADQLVHGKTIGMFDFDKTKPAHLIKMVGDKVNYLIQEAGQLIPHDIGSDLAGTQAAIAKEYLAKQIPALVGLVAGWLAQAAYRPVVDNATNPEENIEKQIKAQIEAMKNGVSDILRPRETRQRFAGTERTRTENIDLPERPPQLLSVGTTIRINDLQAFRQEFPNIDPAVQNIADFQVVGYGQQDRQNLIVLMPILPPGITMPANYAQGVGFPTSLFFKDPPIYSITSVPDESVEPLTGENIIQGAVLRLRNNQIPGQFTEITNSVDQPVALSDFQNGTEFEVMEVSGDTVRLFAGNRSIQIKLSDVLLAFDLGSVAPGQDDLPEEADQLADYIATMRNRITVVGPQPPPPPDPVQEAEVEHNLLEGLIGQKLEVELVGIHLVNLTENAYMVKLPDIDKPYKVKLDRAIPRDLEAPNKKFKIDVHALLPNNTGLVADFLAAVPEAASTVPEPEMSRPTRLELKGVIESIKALKPTHHKDISNQKFVSDCRKACFDLFDENKDQPEDEFRAVVIEGFAVSFKIDKDDQCVIGLRNQSKDAFQSLTATIDTKNGYDNPLQAEIKYSHKGLVGRVNKTLALAGQEFTDSETEEEEESEKPAKKNKKESGLGDSLDIDFNLVATKLKAFKMAQWKKSPDPELVKMWREACFQLYTDHAAEIDAATNYKKKYPVKGFGNLSFEKKSGKLKVILEIARGDKLLFAEIGDATEYTSPDQAQVVYGYANFLTKEALLKGGFSHDILAKAGEIPTASSGEIEILDDEPNLELEDDLREILDRDIFPKLEGLDDPTKAESLKDPNFVRQCRKVAFEYYNKNKDQPVGKFQNNSLPLGSGRDLIIGKYLHRTSVNINSNVGSIICDYGSGEITNPTGAAVLYSDRQGVVVILASFGREPEVGDSEVESTDPLGLDKPPEPPAEGQGEGEQESTKEALEQLVGQTVEVYHTQSEDDIDIPLFLRRNDNNRYDVGSQAVSGGFQIQLDESLPRTYLFDKSFKIKILGVTEENEIPIAKAKLVPEDGGERPPVSAEPVVPSPAETKPKSSLEDLFGPEEPDEISTVAAAPASSEAATAQPPVVAPPEPVVPAAPADTQEGPAEPMEAASALETHDLGDRSADEVLGELMEAESKDPQKAELIVNAIYAKIKSGQKLWFEYADVAGNTTDQIGTIGSVDGLYVANGNMVMATCGNETITINSLIERSRNRQFSERQPVPSVEKRPPYDLIGDRKAEEVLNELKEIESTDPKKAETIVDAINAKIKSGQKLWFEYADVAGNTTDQIGTTGSVSGIFMSGDMVMVTAGDATLTIDSFMRETQNLRFAEEGPKEGAIEVTLANGEKVALEKDQKWKLKYSGQIKNIQINDVKPDGQDFIIQFTDLDDDKSDELTLGKDKWQDTIFKNAELIRE